MSLLNVSLALLPARHHRRAEGEGAEVAVVEEERTAAADRDVRGIEKKSRGSGGAYGQYGRPGVPGHRRSAATPFLTLALIIFLAVGAVLQLLAQYFGVLGLTVSATPNPAEALQAATPLFDNFGAAEWQMDIALTRYATVAWVSSILCACLAGTVFRVPRVEKPL